MGHDGTGPYGVDIGTIGGNGGIGGVGPDAGPDAELVVAVVTVVLFTFC